MLQRRWRAGARVMTVAGAPVALACALGALLLAAGCGGAADTAVDAGAPVPDARAVPPGVHVVFPPPVSMTDQGMLRVRGTASLPAGVAAIRVNGIAATSDNGFVDWQASVPLVLGTNELTVESEDAAGSVDAAAARVSVAMSDYPLSSPKLIGVDEAERRALVLHQLDSVMAVDLDTGERAPLFELPRFDDQQQGYFWRIPLLDAAGRRMLVLREDFYGGSILLYSVDLATGQATERFDFSGLFSSVLGPEAMALDAAGDRIFVSGDEQILAIGLTSGDHAVAVTDSTTGSGPLPQSLAPLVWDASGGRLLVAGASLDMLLAVDRVTGARTVISDAQLDDALALSAPRAMVLDAQRSRVLLTLDAREEILAIDLETGVREQIEPDWGGLQPKELWRAALSMGPGGRRLFIADEAQDAILSLDLATGQVDIVSGETVGEGPAISSSDAMVAAPEAGQVLVLEAERQALMSLDLDTGARAVRFDLSAGAGLGTIWSMAMDAARDRLLLVDSGANALLAVDLATGQRTDFDLSSSGDGVPVFVPRAVVVDAARDRALIVDVVEDSSASYNQIIALDLRTGQRSIAAVLLADGFSSAPQVAGMCLDPLRGRALLTDRTALWGMDLETGAIALVSGDIAGESRGSGPRLRRPLTVFLDAGGTRALVLDDGRLLAVDLDTGDRTLLAGDTAGNGVPLGGNMGAQGGVLDTTPGRALVLGRSRVEGSRSVLSVDLETGERVLVAR